MQPLFCLAFSFILVSVECFFSFPLKLLPQLRGHKSAARKRVTSISLVADVLPWQYVDLPGVSIPVIRSLRMDAMSLSSIY